MTLRPTIASYSGVTYQLMRSALDEDLLAMIEQVATGRTRVSEISPDVLSELVEMHVMAAEGSHVRLNTAVFLAKDIINVAALASGLGKGLAERLISVGAELNDCSPQIKNFLGGIIGVSQGLSQVFRDGSLAVDWGSYGGRYAQAKVDFDQDCDVYRAMPPDWQNKSVLRGEGYTAVFIGTGGVTYQSLLSVITQPAFRSQLLRHLTDAYGSLLAGQSEDKGLQQTACEIGFFREGQPGPILVTRAVFQKHWPTIQKVADLSCRFYLDHLNQIEACLRSTDCGLQGVPPKNMMMHFWRYCRRALAQELYTSGFLTDQVPINGSITVFYDNSIEELNRLI